MISTKADPTLFDLDSPGVQCNLARFNGEVVLVRVVKGGWTTITTQENKTIKCRNGAVTLLTNAEVQELIKTRDRAKAIEAKKAAEKQLQTGESVYTCQCCGRKTRSAGRGDNDQVRLCADCYEMAGLHNRVLDGDPLTEEEREECRKRCAFIVSKGGTPDAEHVEMCGFDESQFKSASAVDSSYKTKMVKTPLTLPNGTKKIAQDCDDPVANEFRKLNLATVYERVADALATVKHKRVQSSGSGVSADVAAELRQMYGQLNPGMQRMNLGNLYRTAKKAV